MNNISYGWVNIVKGKNKGTVGYYDNDEGEKCVVYLGPPPKSKYVLLTKKSISPVKSLAKSTVKSLYERVKYLESEISDLKCRNTNLTNENIRSRTQYKNVMQEINNIIGMSKQLQKKGF